MFKLKELFQTIEGYGYKYSGIDFIKSVGMYTIIIAYLAHLHHLKFIWISLLIITVVVMFPFMVHSQYYYLHEQRRFQELCTYLKQMIVNFKTHQKIYLALKETRNAFSEDSEMYKTITKAMQCIDDGKSFREAFDVIEEKYFNSYVNQLHSYLILGEQEGGNIVYESLSHIDFQEWQTDTYSFQIAKDKLKKQNGIFAAMALCMTLFIFHFFPSDIMDPLLALQEFQIYTFIYFEIVLVAFIVVKAFLTGKWIKEDE